MVRRGFVLVIIAVALVVLAVASGWEPWTETAPDHTASSISVPVPAAGAAKEPSRPFPRTS